MPVILLIGDFSEERVDLAALCQEFGWGIKRPEEGVHGAIAVIVDAAQLGQVKKLFPNIPIIAAKHFHSEDAEDGAVFDTLLRPFDPGECRQTLTFLHQVARPTSLHLIAAA